MVDASALLKCSNLKYVAPWISICMINIFYQWATSLKEGTLKHTHGYIWGFYCWTFYILNEMKCMGILCFVKKKYAHVLPEALNFMKIPTVRLLRYKVSTLNVIMVLYKRDKGIKQNHDFTKKPFYIYDVQQGLALRTLLGSYYYISTHQMQCT
jgi:hypothetical protein